MLAEINLLPRKDQKSKAKRFVILLISVIAILSIILFFFHAQSLIQEKEALTSKNRSLKSQFEEKVTAQNEREVNSSGEILQSAVDFAEAVTNDMIPILDELVEQLPERGYFLRYEQADPKTINIVVQFDSNREAAFYLSRLKDSPTIFNVFLSNLKVLEESTNQQQTFDGNIQVPRVEATYQIEIQSSVKVKENGGDNNEDSAS